MKLVTGFFIFLALVFSACFSEKQQETSYKKNRSYPHNGKIKTPVALLIKERNSVPFTLASGFLVDKQAGIFGSAKHFIGIDEPGEYKLFFNGVVYDCFLLRLPVVSDIVLLKIQGKFNPKDFPEPYPFAKNIKIGEKVFIRGIHPHLLDKISIDLVLPIFKDYYDLVQHKNNLKEFVFDNLSAKVTELNITILNSSIGGSRGIQAISGTYFNTETDKDHESSFGGLSGGPIVNEAGELIGITSFEEVKNNFDKKEYRKISGVYARELEKLMQIVK